MSSRRNHYRDTGFVRGWESDRRLSEAKALAELREMGEHVVKAAKEALKEGVDEKIGRAHV